MAGSSFLDVCRFTPTLGGSTDWTYLSAVTGYQSPTAAGAVNGAQYSYRAESADLSQWEVGVGTWNSSTGVLSRTTVLFSTNSNAKVTFSAVPQVAVVALKEDLPTLPVSVANGGTGDTGTAWTAFTPSPTGSTFTFLVNSARFKTLGKTTFVQMDLSLGTVTGGPNSFSWTLPNTANSAGAIPGTEIASSGIGAACRVAAGSTAAICTGAAGAPFTTGQRFVFSGVYENT